jgi:hypothetical protein
MHLSPNHQRHQVGPCTAIRTLPEPSVFPILDSIKEVFANDVSLIGDFLSAVLLSDDIFEFCIIPAFHALFLLLACPSVRIHVLFGSLPLNGKIMREFAFLSSLALALLEIYASMTISPRVSCRSYSTVLGSVPKGTFCTACTGLKSSASSFLRASSAFFLSSCAFFRSSASFCGCQRTANVKGSYLCFCTDSRSRLLLLDLLHKLLYSFRFVFL